ncbi:MAG: hypothetical protein V3T58_07960 [Candidatus Hydrothermarchaeales archaeon]
MKELGGLATIKEVKGFIEEKYPGRWKDISTNMVDLSVDSTSSSVPMDKRFLSRIGRGRYKLLNINQEAVGRKIPVQKLSKSQMSPFKESEVEDLLVEWFKNKGYKVITQCVDDPNKFDGITKCKTHSIWGIDVVAQKKRDLWIIEVKGEDKGRSASGSVNFASGLGQLLSYMTKFDDNIHYGLAIPHPSKDFKSTIKKMGKSKAFEELGIHLFLVEKEGVVKHILPNKFQEFVKE